MPGAAKHIECPLCKFFASERPLSEMPKLAQQVLQRQPKKKPTRTCPGCNSKVSVLVTSRGKLVCADCAMDDDESSGGDGAQAQA